ncbi:MAG: acyl-CoA desaturase, partial [Acidimicrobiales bacterium]|nr:acyl-CoA desaturase [Acidimicrobiales bacterium]
MTTTAERYNLTAEQLDAFGKEIDAIRKSVVDDLGQADVDYIRNMIKIQRGLEIGGRGLLFAGFLPPAWLAGTAMLGMSKILDNMEIGHNVMHGQYDWTRDPNLQAKSFDWDTAAPGDQWRHSHNYLHHTFTNIQGKDRDIGYGVLRMSEDQPWHPVYLANPIIGTALMLNFDLGVMLHDVEFDQVMAGKKSWATQWPVLRDGLRKTGKLLAKDYVIWPLLTGPMFLSTLVGNFVADTMRNIWAFTIIFCGHFPAGVHEFTIEECEGESKGHWYFRQMLGSANITGGKLFHILSGNLSHQIEHHL